jgi:hypothetical protein
MRKGQLLMPMLRGDKQMRKCISLTCLRSTKAHLPVRSVSDPASVIKTKITTNHYTPDYTHLHCWSLVIKRCRCALTQQSVEVHSRQDAALPLTNQ